MPRAILDKKIQLLFDEVLILDSMVEEATLGAVQALKKQDLKAARRYYTYDQAINQKRYQLENEVIVTIATQQPVMASDLRTLASLFEISGELERMGDYAKGIAYICLLIGNQPLVKPLIDIPKMAEITVGMLDRAVNAFISGDVESAKQIPEEDDEVDELYNQVYRELVAVMIADPATIDRANYLMWAAHNLERMADRVTNICERTIYASTGELTEIDTSDDELQGLIDL